MAKAKDIKNVFSVVIAAGAATPAPPLGPVLGQNGLNPADFCSKFNEKTREMAGDELPVVVTVYNNGEFDMRIKQPTVASMLKKAANIQKGSEHPKIKKVGKVSKAKVREIAARKMPDLNTVSAEAAERIVEGTARSLGLEIV